MTKFYDISLTLSNDIPTWPGDRPPLFKHKGITIDGNAVQVSKMDMSVHTGTHIDAPRHFVEGANTIEMLPLHVLIGPAKVVLLPPVKAITKQILIEAKIPSNTKRLLLKTENSYLWAKKGSEFTEEYASLHVDGAMYLVELGVELIGIDYLSIAPFNDLVPTHRVLLEANMVIIEGLDLSKVDPGPYTLHCLPLKIAGSDGAPARVVLTKY